MNIENLSVSLITQGDRKFYSLTMPIDLIAETCTPNARSADPAGGFQRSLDESRAISIAEYIRGGGVIPSSIILSAQVSANFTFHSKNKTISFDVSQSSFLILDGQHRVYGFRKLLNEGVKYRIPVIIFSGLSPIQEARLFIDLNTLQKPVPKELLLDIKKLAETESMDEILLDELFTNFETTVDSFLAGKLSRFEKKSNKISKVTFYDALKPIVRDFQIDDVTRLYKIINNYLHAINDVMHDEGVELNNFIIKATVFKILICHAKSIISAIADRDADKLETQSEYKRYLKRSIPGSTKEIFSSTSYQKTAANLDKKILKNNVKI